MCNDLFHKMVTLFNVHGPLKTFIMILSSQNYHGVEVLYNYINIFLAADQASHGPYPNDLELDLQRVKLDLEGYRL